MLTRQATERAIAEEIPLKKGRKLDVTNLKVSVYTDDGITVSVPAPSLRCIIPLDKKKVRIQYWAPVAGNPEPQRQYTDIELHKPEREAVHLCRQIKDAYEKAGTFSHNPRGFVLLVPDERIVTVYDDIRTEHGRGMMYITNVGVIVETGGGVMYEIPFDCIQIISDHKKDSLRLVWTEGNATHKADLRMSGSALRNEAGGLIRRELDTYRSGSGYEFRQLDAKYSQLSVTDIREMVGRSDPEYARYVRLHAIQVFGFESWSEIDASHVLACKILGVNPEVLVRDMPEDELRDRRRYVTKFTPELERKLYEYEMTLTYAGNITGSALTPETKKQVVETDEWKELVKTANTMLEDEDLKWYFGAESKRLAASMFRADIRMTGILYDIWRKDHPLTDFRDGYDTRWIDWLLKETDRPEYDLVFGYPYFERTSLIEMIKIADRNRATLESFRKPDGIPDEDIFNNCWYDKKNKMWWVQDDHLPDCVTELAASDPDHSQATIGRRVWGFAEKDVLKVYDKYPTILLDLPGCDWLVDRPTSKWDPDTGYIGIVKGVSRIRHSLAIIREGQIREIDTPVMATYMRWQSPELHYIPMSNGSMTTGTPRSTHEGARLFRRPFVPFNERLRRVLFSAFCGLGFNGYVPYTEEQPYAYVRPEKRPGFREDTKWEKMRMEVLRHMYAGDLEWLKQHRKSRTFFDPNVHGDVKELYETEPDARKDTFDFYGMTHHGTYY